MCSPELAADSFIVIATARFVLLIGKLVAGWV